MIGSRRTSLKATSTGVVLLAVLIAVAASAAPSYAADPPTPPAEKLRLLAAYAPLVKLAPGEPYLPLAVEVLTDPRNTTRTWIDKGENNKGWWLVSKQPLKDGGDDSLPFFKGTGTKAPVYAFWSEHAAGVNLVYFFFYGYNRGKEKAGTFYGNHMGDIEHIVVRLERSKAGAWAPTKAYCSSHDAGDELPWQDVKLKKVETHPIIYSAWGSHGCYFAAGSHKYKDIPIIGPLVDQCGDEGSQWKTWENIVALDYNAEVNLKGGPYPVWMGKQATRSTKETTAIWRFGNPEMVSVGDFKAVSPDAVRFVDGPVSPAFKTCWGAKFN